MPTVVNPPTLIDVVTPPEVVVVREQPAALVIVAAGSPGAAGVTDHGALTGLGDDDHPQYAEIATVESISAPWTFITHPLGLDHVNLANIGVNSHATIDLALSALALHIADGTIHFTEGSINHANILGIGTNSHAAIDTHIADAAVHFAQTLSTSIADFTIGQKYYLTRRVNARPVTRIDIVIQGSAGQSLTWELRKGADLSAAGTVVHAATTTDVTTGVSITSPTTPAIAADDHLWFEFTAKAGTLIAFNGTVSF